MAPVLQLCVHAGLQAMELGGNAATMKSVYSNAVTTSQSGLARRCVERKLNFAKVASKTTASVHIKNKDLNTSLVVAFIRSGYAVWCS